MRQCLWIASNAVAIIFPVAGEPFQTKSAPKTESPTNEPGVSIFRADFIILGCLLGLGLDELQGFTASNFAQTPVTNHSPKLVSAPE